MTPFSYQFRISSTGNQCKICASCCSACALFTFGSNIWSPLCTLPVCVFVRSWLCMVLCKEDVVVQGDKQTIQACVSSRLSSQPQNFVVVRCRRISSMTAFSTAPIVDYYSIHLTVLFGNCVSILEPVHIHRALSNKQYFVRF
ncbi:Interferon-induced GTP-binding protein [Trichinella spiralis]|uniref:Interferon-induced GTP-binding protein n=1 Tax=Trichinella spiralis TaxID=6334 RepID=A0ABR3KSI1_TRISP